MEARLQKGTLQKGDLQTVRKEVDRLNILLSDLLHLQQAREPERKQQLLRPVLMHCVDLVSAQASMQDIHLNLIAEENLQAVFDQRHLTQAVVNLLLNSLQVSSQGQEITLRAQLDSTGVLVLVQDEGPGLSETAVEHLFEPLFTTKPEGTGLGLAVSRELMRSQHGDLKYISNGRGACFSIELPKD
jgi:signal transduction histidine kinase